MHKKLYKAKKNWVIGLVAGSILMFGCVAGANADDQVNVSQPDTNTSALSQMTEQATDPNNQVVSSDHTNNQVEVIKNQNNTVNNSQPVITMQDEYLNKATIFERDSDLYTFGYGDISPDNIAVPIQNGKNIDFKNDDDSSPMISWYRGHYNSHINAHQTLFSKNIIRRGQQYTVGVASANDNVTFLPYIQNENNMVVGDGAGISESPYSLAGQYFGPSFQGGANIEWNNYQAHAFGVAEYNDNDVFSELPKAYHDSSTIETNLFVTMQDNGVIDYKTLWKNYSKNSNDIGFLRDSTYPEEQPFAFEFGNIRFKTDDKYIRMSPIWQITNTLYFNYGLVDKYTDNPQYILQFIKTNGSETKVMSEIKNPILDLYSSEEENKNIPGLAQFVPENAKTFNRGIVIYSPVTETNMTNIHNGLGTIAFGKNNREHTINFQRVFMNANELKGMNANQILAYVYGLFNGEDEKNRKEKDSVTTVIYQERNGNIVEKINLPNSNQNTINIKNLNEELSKKAIHFKDKSGEDQIGHYEISDLSQYKDTIPTGKASVILVDFIVDFDLEKAKEEYVVDQAVDGAIDKLAEQLTDFMKKQFPYFMKHEILSRQLNTIIVKPFLSQNKKLKSILSTIYTKIYKKSFEEDNDEWKMLESELSSTINGIKETLMNMPINIIVNNYRGQYIKNEKEYDSRTGRYEDKKVWDSDKTIDNLAELSENIDNPISSAIATGIHSFGVVSEDGTSMGEATAIAIYGVRHGFNKEDAELRYDYFNEEWERTNNANLQGEKLLLMASQLYQRKS